MAKKTANNNQETKYEQLYKELYAVVNVTLASKPGKKRIELAVENIADAFMEEPYNPLLLHFYFTSTENYLISHIVNNVILAVGFGVSLDLSRENLIQLGLCAFCHDFGMMDYTHLFQQDKKLTDYENKMIQKHPAKSVEMFKDIFSEDIMSAVEDVHEQVNGEGYPKGKSGAQIAFLAKIVAICDVFEALTHQRNSRKHMVPYEAIKVIIKQKDQVFDGRVVKRFVDFMSIYPIGSLVYLNTGEIGIVIGSNYGYPTRCIVRILLTANHEIDSSGKVFNLFKDTMVYVNRAVAADEELEIVKVLNPRGNFQIDEGADNA